MTSQHHAVLYALFRLARADHHATVLRVTRAASRYLPAELSRQTAAQLLAELDKAGLVDQDRVRLTLQGLTLATALGRPRAAAARRKALAQAA